MSKLNIEDALNKIPSTDTVEKKVMKFMTIVLVIAIFVIVIFCIVMANALMPVDRNDTNKVEFKVQAGWGSSKVVDELYEKQLIKNDKLIKLYLKFNPQDNIKEGTYYISKAMSVTDILEMLSSNKSVENETINITLVEGKRFTSYMEQVSSTFGFNYDDVMKVASSEEYLNKLIQKHWFITDDIKNDKLYYPLEGYIFADTYNIRKNATIEEVLDTFIDELGTKLAPYKDTINGSSKSIHSLLTLASMIELEAGTGNFTLSNGLEVSERKVVSSIFNNRLNQNMRLGSDVTTYYDAKRKMQDSINDVLTICNGYNTREEAACVSGLPVGPICSPSLSSIEAAINPATTDYLYFVADKDGKLYAATDYNGHINNINYLKSHNLWN